MEHEKGSTSSSMPSAMSLGQDTPSSISRRESCWEEGVLTVAPSIRSLKEKTDSSLPDGLSDPSSSQRQPRYICFAPGDPSNPYLWPLSKRWAVLLWTCTYTFLVSASGSAYPSGIPGQMIQIPGYSDQVWLIGLVMYSTSCAIGPLVLAPLSEVYGRKPIFLISCFFFGIFKIPIAAASSFAAVMVGQFLSGLGAGVGNSMIGAIVADLFRPSESGLPMATYVVISIIGTATGEVAAAYVAQSDALGGQAKAWRFIHWFQLIWTFIEALYFLFFMPETRSSVLLSRRAAKLRKETGNRDIHAQADLERDSVRVLLHVSMTRPFYMLFKEPIVISLSLYLTLCWALLYLFISGVPQVFGTIYSFTGAMQTLPFMAVGVGGSIGYALNFIQMHLYKNARSKTGISQTSLLGARLYSAMPFGIVLAASLFMYAWTSTARVHWIVPCLAIAFAFSAVFTILLAVFNLLSDAYGRYASSALSAQGFLRNFVGGTLCLAATPLYHGLGFQWGTSVLAFIALGMASIPFILFTYMHWIRSHSHFAGEIMREEAADEERERKLERSPTLVDGESGVKLEEF